jgi:hypothetical protein
VAAPCAPTASTTAIAARRHGCPQTSGERCTPCVQDTVGFPRYKVDFSNDLRGSFLYRRTEFRTQCEHPSNRACVVHGVHRLAVTEAYADANTSFFTALFLSAEKNKHWAKWPCLPGLWVGNLPSVCTEAEIKALFDRYGPGADPAPSLQGLGYLLPQSRRHNPTRGNAPAVQWSPGGD